MTVLTALTTLAISIALALAVGYAGLIASEISDRQERLRHRMPGWPGMSIPPFELEISQWIWDTFYANHS